MTNKNYLTKNFFLNSRLIIVICIAISSCSNLSAQTATVVCSYAAASFHSGAVTSTGTVTDGNIVATGSTASPASQRGFCVFNIAGASIPANATITAVTMSINKTTVTGAGTPGAFAISGYTGDISTIASSPTVGNTALYAAVSSTANGSDVGTISTTSWGTTTGNVTLTFNATGIALVQNNLTGNISAGFSITTTTRVYTILGEAGATKPTLNITYLLPCTTPAPGNTISNTNPACSGVNFTLSLQSATAGSGVTYQWQRADNAAFTTNLTNLGTASTQVTNQTSPKYYRCNVTCSTGPTTVTSNPLFLTNGFINCHCTPVFATNSDPITLVNFAGINNSSCATKNCSPSYQDFSAISGTATQGTSYPISVKAYTDGNFTFYVRVFIDFDENGLFTDPGETFDIGTIVNSSGLDAVVATGNILIPNNALIGTTRMRVTSRYSTAASSCETTGEGQAEDYFLAITGPPCTGIPSPGNTIASANPACSGTNFTLSMQNGISGSGIIYQWQQADDSLFTVGLNNLGTSYSQVISETSAKYYRCRVICTTGPDTAYSNRLLVTTSFIACYCTPTYTSGIEPITSVNVAGINNSSAQTGGTSLENFTNITGIVALGSSYPIIIKGNTVGNYSDSLRVFIDFNHNGLFTDAGESFNLGIITNSTGTDAVQASGNILIPNTALSGITRMRVTKLYNGSGTNLPCVTSGYGQAEDYSLNIVNSSTCTSAPSPGNTISGANPVCPSVPFTLTLQNLTAQSGISYQWQSADDNAFTVNVTNLDTNSSQTVSQTSAKYYRCLVTCSSGPFTAASTPLQVTMNPFTNCYCTPVFATNSDPVTLVNFAGINNTSCATKNCSPSYEDYTAISGTAMQGATYPFTMKAYTDGSYTFYERVFIDFNQNGSFADAGETFNLGTITNSTGVDAVVATGNIVIPITALTGSTRMRVTSKYSTAATSCETSGEGQAEDYLLNITAAPNCSGSPAVPSASAQQTQLCLGSTVAHLSITDYSNTVLGIMHQWKSSANQGGPYSNIPGATSDTYTSGSLAAATYYVCLDSCIYSHQTSQSNELGITIVDPQIINTTAGSRCGAGTVDLLASVSIGASADWYSAASGGSPLYSGSPFTTPVIGTTTTFYVSASAGGSAYGGGKPSSNGADGTNTEGGIFFTASQQFTLNSVVMYPTGAGTNTIVLYAGSVSTGTPIFSYTATFAGASTTGITVPLGWAISPGNYTLYSTGGTASCWRDYSASSVPLIAYPYTIGPACTLTDGSLSGYYYFFFNWSISTGCVSSRIPVTASVSTAPTITVSSSPTICSGQSTIVSVSSSNDFNYKYTWNPGSLVGSTVSVSPASTTTFTVSALDTTGGTNQGCANSATVLVNVNPSPSNVTASITQPICLESPVSLVAAADPYNTVILNSDFNSGAQGWTAQNTGAASTAWTLRPDGYNIPTYGTAPVHSNDNSQFYLSNSSSSGNAMVSSLQSPSFSTMGFASCNLSFYQFYIFWASTDSIVVEASLNGTSWTSVKVYPNLSIGGYSNFTQDNVSLNAFINQPTVFVRFRYRANFSYWWAIDNVVISGNYQNFTYTWSSTPIGYSSALKNPPSFLPNAATSSYSVILTNSFGCTNTASTGALTYYTPPKPKIAEADTAVCGNSPGFYVHAHDTGSFAGGYPSGTYFEWVNYTPATQGLDSLFVNSTDDYKVVITLPGSAGGCSDTSNVIHADFTGAQAPVPFMEQDSVRCFGESSGRARAHLIVGGSSLINYRWYNSSNILLRDVTTSAIDDTLKNVPPGVYSVTIYNNVGTTFLSCEEIGEVEVLQAGPVSVSENTANHVNNLCYNNPSGAIDINVSGGNPEYHYNWSNGATTEDVNGLQRGTYTVIVTDFHGCTTSLSSVITGPDLLVATCSSTNVNCNGNNNGTGSVTGSGGVLPYHYHWENGSTNSSVSGLAPGNYCVTITDNNGCTASCCISITQPNALTITSTVINVTCKNAHDGKITVIPSGGTPGYSYIWNDLNHLSSRTGLGPGTYTVTVTDSHGCTASAVHTILQSAAQMVVNINKTNVTCGGKCTGTANATPSGGTAPYIYVWSTGATIAKISSLCAGTYTVTVTDAYNCVKTVVVPVTQNPLLILVASPSGPTQATASPSGGVPPYTYYWNTSPPQTSSTAIGLFPGSGYKVKVLDYKGCSKTASVSIPLPKAEGDLNANDGVEITVYPNPTTGNLTLNFNDLNRSYEYTLILYDLTGRQVFIQNSLKEQGVTSIEYDFGSLSKGIYTLNVLTERGNELVKIVLE